MDVKFEYLGEDVDSPNAKIWKVEALHVTTTRNKRKFTKEELTVSGRSLSFRPLNINHDEHRQLSFPDNSTRAMHFNPTTMAVEGSFRVTDPIVNAMIETGRINSVSIEQIPTLGESCNQILCEQHGVAFIGMALLESNVPPGDPGTVNKIVKSESFTELLVSDEQRVCKECSDVTACHECSHKEFDEILEACLSRRQIETPEMPMDMRVVQCLEELNRVDTPEAQAGFKGITIQLNETYDKIESLIHKWSRAGVPLNRSIPAALERYVDKPALSHYYYKVASEKFHSKKNENDNEPVWLDEISEDDFSKISKESNPNHAPAGTDKGGQFTGDGGSGGGKPSDDTSDTVSKSDILTPKKVKYSNNHDIVFGGVGKYKTQSSSFVRSVHAHVNKSFDNIPSHLFILSGDKTIVLMDRPGKTKGVAGVFQHSTKDIKFRPTGDIDYNTNVLTHELAHKWDEDHMDGSRRDEWDKSDIMKEPLTKYTKEILEKHGDKSVRSGKMGNKFRVEQFAEMQRLVFAPPTKFLGGKRLTSDKTFQKQRDFFFKLTGIWKPEDPKNPFTKKEKYLTVESKN